MGTRAQVTRRPPRVVLDTNVVLSALVFGGGHAARVRRAWTAGHIVPLASADTVKELIRVLAYPKFKLSPSEREELLADFLPFAQTVQIPDPPPMAPACRDPHDMPFLHLALAGKARALVTGDRDLLVLAPTPGISIVTLEEFAASMEV